MAEADKPTEELALQSDQKEHFAKRMPFPTVRAMTKAGRGPLVDGEGFALEVAKRHFSQATNVEGCAGIVEVCTGISARAAVSLLS